MIRVDDVADVTNISRRALERRLRKILGRSVYEKIRRVHVEQAARLVVETNLPVSQIASALEFSSNEHMRRCFRREKQISPLAYHKRYGCKQM